MNPVRRIIYHSRQLLIHGPIGDVRCFRARRERSGTPTAERWKWRRGSAAAFSVAAFFAVVYAALTVLTTAGIVSGGVLTVFTLLLQFLIAPLGLAAIAYLIFLGWRRWRVIRWYQRRCERHPQARVPTAGSMIREVVGRDALCRMLIENVRLSPTPNIVVGGVGAGKTALLVRLVDLLAQQNVVPVAVQLRDARDELDFHDLGFKAFQRELRQLTIPGGDVERCWNQLRREGRVVVLADGLEDALPEDAGVEDRQNKIQLSLRDAADNNLPLIITSRHHAPLRALDAPITTLDPVGEGPALGYLAGGVGEPERRELANLVHGADVTDSPLYLRIIRDLVDTGRLRQVAPEHDLLRQLTVDFEGRLRSGHEVDRCDIRLRLLRCWRQLLLDGDLLGDYALKPERRQRTLTVLAALACIGLRDDRSEVLFTDLIGSPPVDGQARSGSSRPPSPVTVRLCENLPGSRFDRSVLTRAVDDQRPLGFRPATAKVDPMESMLYDKLRDECELAAQYGTNLGIVEQKGFAVRFHHTIIQAYLGVDYLGYALADDAYLDRALTVCGREFLLALTLYSRARHLPDVVPSGPWTGLPAREDRGGRAETDDGGGQGRFGSTVRMVRRKAAVRTRLLRTTRVPVRESVEVATAGPDRDALRNSRWYRRLMSHVDQIDRVKKLRICTAAAEIEAGHQWAGETPTTGTALSWLKGLAMDWSNDKFRQPDIQDRTLLEAKAHLLRRIGATTRLLAIPAGDGSGGGGSHYGDLYQIAVAEDDDTIELIATQEIARGGDRAFDQLRKQFGEWWKWWNGYWAEWRPFFGGGVSGRTGDTADVISEMERQFRVGRVCALLAPMLFYHGQRDFPDPTTSLAWTQDTSPRSAFENLKWWITEFLAKADPTHPEKRPWISLEMALAQGFRYAANHRSLQTIDNARRRAALIEQAEAALRHTRFWYAQLILIQALTLLELPEPSDEGIRRRGHGSDPRQLTQHWVETAGAAFTDLLHRAGPAKHPFVRETAELCERALCTGAPVRYCWIDETSAVEKVGALQQPGQANEQLRWILPSSGWGALSKRAQHLLGDVILMLNLAKRGRSPAEREERLNRADCPNLPPCLRRDPDAMDVSRTVGSAMTHDPGSNCHDDCQLRLCPYPPIGDLGFRAELPEGFCHQLAHTRLTLPYEDHVSRKQHKRFWDSMSMRARPGRR